MREHQRRGSAARPNHPHPGRSGMLPQQHKKKHAEWCRENASLAKLSSNLHRDAHQVLLSCTSNDLHQVCEKLTQQEKGCITIAAWIGWVLDPRAQLVISEPRTEISIGYATQTYLNVLHNGSSISRSLAPSTAVALRPPQRGEVNSSHHLFIALLSTASATKIHWKRRDVAIPLACSLV